MLKIFKYTFSDLIRSRWSYVYFGFYLLISVVLLSFSTDLSRAITSLMNVVIILSPLIGTIFGAMYYYNSRDFLVMLLAQPLKRSTVFLGNFLGLASSLSLSFVLGLGIPFIFYGIMASMEIWNFAILLFVGSMLTFVFVAIAFLIAIINEDKIKGFGIAMMVWLFLAVIYDGLFLLTLIGFEDYPLDNLALGAMLFNPIDLARTLIILKLDISALLGYTGAVFTKFFGGTTGLFIALFFFSLWVLIPTKTFLRVASKKDF